MFRFAHPALLYLLLLVPLLALFMVWGYRQKKKAIARFGSSALMEKLSRSVSRRRQVAKSVLIAAGVLFLVLSIARPQYGTRMRTVKREGQ
ncbi:BatA domain-containing protein, partial [bacterium]|nr:BatA domain-containing protein [bacterium]